MQELWEAVYTRLSTDAALLLLLGDATHIVRTYQLKPGSPMPVVAFGDRGHGKLDVEVAGVRVIDEIVIVLGDDELNVDEVGEQVISRIDGTNEDMSTASLWVYESTWDNFQSTVYYSDEYKAYREDIRFQYIVRLL